VGDSFEGGVHLSVSNNQIRHIVENHGMTLEDFPEIETVIISVKVIGILGLDKLPYGNFYALPCMAYMNINTFWNFV
jgi:hypothetical protein